MTMGIDATWPNPDESSVRVPNRAVTALGSSKRTGHGTAHVLCEQTVRLSNLGCGLKTVSGAPRSKGVAGARELGCQLCAARLLALSRQGIQGQQQL
jgi:hypothetical protein